MNISLVTSLVTAMSVLALAVGVFYVRLRRSAKTIARLAPAIVEAPQFFALLDVSVPHSHFLERHGPLLNQMDLLERAKSGAIPFSRHLGRPVDATRWLKHEDLLWAVESALSHWGAGERPAGGVYHFCFNYVIGEGYAKGSCDRTETAVARVIIRRGDVITAYPVLPPLGNEPHQCLERSYGCKEQLSTSPNDSPGTINRERNR